MKIFVGWSGRISQVGEEIEWKQRFNPELNEPIQ